MSYENPRIPEGINVDVRHPLREFASLSLKGLALLLLLALAATLVGGFVGRHMPVAWENALADATIALPVEDAGVEAALQHIADRLAAHMDLPAEMTITVHYIDRPVVNAAATLGGHVFVFRGLLARLPHENALAMVLAHEIAHVRNRDVAANIGSVAMLTLIASAVTGRSSSLVDGVTGGTGLLVLLRFGREAESAADRDALAAMARLYGHIGGVEDLYRVLAEAGGERSGSVPEFLRSHPLTADRVAAIAALAQERSWPGDGPFKLLPPVLSVSVPEAAPGNRPGSGPGSGPGSD